MKWELWKEDDGREIYIISHRMGDYSRKELSNEAKVVWSCDAESPHEAQARLHEYRGFKLFRLWTWLRYSKTTLAEWKRTYKDRGLEK